MQNLEASISLCDPLNPGFGYQIRITRSAPPGAPVEVLFTSRNPATGSNLLTYEQCLDVLELYRSTPRKSTAKSGFILRAEGSTRHFFSSYLKNEMQHVEDRNCAWFTTDHNTAHTMVLELTIRTGQKFEILPHTHSVS
jgi:hypothetical protein